MIALENERQKYIFYHRNPEKKKPGTTAGKSPASTE
jgi:hypothetical protein